MMTTSVTITGTGFPAPSARRAGPGVLVRSGDVTIQFDVGRSTVQRLTACNVSMADLDALFITHHHSDHLVDAPDLVMTRWLTYIGDRPEPLPIVAPAGPAVAYLRSMLDPWEIEIAERLPHMGRRHGPDFDVVPFDVPPEPMVVWSSGAVTVSAGRVRHEPLAPAVGYRIETPDGVVAITGDTIVCDEVAELARGADVLVYEAIRVEPVLTYRPDLAYVVDYHADSRDIGAQAAELDIATLVLTHLCPEPKSDDDSDAFERDIRAGGFTGDVVVADDLDTVELDGVRARRHVVRDPIEPDRQRSAALETTPATGHHIDKGHRHDIDN